MTKIHLVGDPKRLTITSGPDKTKALNAGRKVFLLICSRTI